MSLLDLLLLRECLFLQLQLGVPQLVFESIYLLLLFADLRIQLAYLLTELLDFTVCTIPLSPGVTKLRFELALGIFGVFELSCKLVDSLCLFPNPLLVGSLRGRDGVGQTVYLGPRGLVLALDRVELVFLVGDGLQVILDILAEFLYLIVQLGNSPLAGLDLRVLDLQLLGVELLLVDNLLLALLVVNAKLCIFLHQILVLQKLSFFFFPNLLQQLLLVIAQPLLRFHAILELRYLVLRV